MRKIALIFTAVLAFSPLGIAQAYQQTNLVSDIQGLAQNPPSGQPDAQLINPWGLISSSTSPWWVSDNNAGVSTLYDGQGVKQGLVVNIPSPVTGVAGTPTGVVFTGAAGFTFHAKNAQGQDTTTGAVFTFVTEDGTIVAWGPGINPTDLPNDAFVVVDKSKAPSANKGAVYKGATIAQMKAGGPFFLYVANFRSGRIEVYDTKFKRVDLDDVDNDHGDEAFTDREIPSGFAPFNVQNIGGQLYVTYAKQDATKHDDVPGAGNGYVDIFDTSGNFVRRLISNGALNSPWGLALAPTNFGTFSGALLVGNFGNGKINAFDPATGTRI